MSRITDYFLRAKHWQMFLLLTGMFCIAGFATWTTAPPTGNLEGIGLFSLLIVGPVEFWFLFWLWSLGTFFRSMVPPALRLNLGFFRFALIYPALYLLVFMIFFQSQSVLLFAVIVPLHLFAMFCMFYSLYFVSKSLALAETGEPVSFYNYAGPFFLIWYFPIGVWIIQPRVNRLYAASKSRATLE
jgi:hypothetical protein